MDWDYKPFQLTCIVVGLDLCVTRKLMTWNWLHGVDEFTNDRARARVCMCVCVCWGDRGHMGQVFFYTKFHMEKYTWLILFQIFITKKGFFELFLVSLGKRILFFSLSFYDSYLKFLDIPKYTYSRELVSW